MGDGEFVIEWGRPEALTPGVLGRDGFSATDGADVPGGTSFPMSVIFDRAQVELQGAEAPLSGAWAGVLRLPFRLPNAPPAVWFKSDLRISAQLAEGASALFVARLAGETYVKELGGAESFGRDADPFAPLRQDGVGVLSREFTVELVHKAEAVPATEYVASLFLSASRRTADGVVRVSLDSLDIVVNPNFQPTPQ